MKKLYNENWKFLKSPVGTTFEEVRERLGDFECVSIPHDFLIEDAHNLYADATGWYLNHFEAVEGRRLFFVFDGIYMDSIVYINGKIAGEWKSGYTQFVLEVTDFVKPGTNEIMVAARCRFPSARWYTGGGIYRNVWLCDYGCTYIPENGIYVHSKKVDEGYLLEVETEVICGKIAGSCMSNLPQKDSTITDECAPENAHRSQAEEVSEKHAFTLRYAITDANGDEITLIPYDKADEGQSSCSEWEHFSNYGSARSLDCKSKASTDIQDDSCITSSSYTQEETKHVVSASFLVKNPTEWDVSSPTLYNLRVMLCESAEGERSGGRLPSAEIIARVVDTSLHHDVYSKENYSSDVSTIKKSAPEKLPEENSSSGIIREENTSSEILRKENPSPGIHQTETLKIGFRNLRFDANKGFFINGRHTKINGVCIHHDLGALGVAFSRCAMKRRLVQLKKMGVNAIRLSHNVYDPAVLELADKMGFLVDSEALDMWERPKTEFDFSHFFTDWYEKEVASWVRRDRNHPSVFMWSIGNEIYDTHADERGLELTKILRDEVKKHDPKGNGLVTSASNYMPWENAQKCADELELVGYNYAERCYKEHHESHPDWIIYGSETYSIVQSRGIYHFPLSETVLSDSDLQCSSLGNSQTSWGAESIEACICDDRDMEFSLGQFIWTGYDYIGEPTPYQTKNSYFGLIDTAGFFKDAYYVFKSAWVSCEEDPFVHIFPYWDFNEGQTVDVRVSSNLPVVELFLNGKSLGRQELTHAPGSGHHIIADYSAVYEKGELRAVGYDKDGNVITEDFKRSFRDTCNLKVDLFDGNDRLVRQSDSENECSFDDSDRINEKSDSENIYKVDNDLIFAEISAVDADGNPVENANNYVKVCVTDGTLVGFDNGDSTDYDSYKADTRRLFSGKALAIVKRASADVMPTITASIVPGHDIRAIRLHIDEDNTGTSKRSDAADSHDISDSNGSTNSFKISESNGTTIIDENITAATPATTTLTPDRKTITVSAEVFPAGADTSDLRFRVLNRKGVDTNIAKVTQDGNMAHIEALGDGEFRLRAEANNGAAEVKVISELGFTIDGLGAAFLDPFGYTSASLYTSTKGEIAAGNEQGIATAREAEAVITYDGVDFGRDGSDEITVDIFALTDESCVFEIWKGVPGEEGSVLLSERPYHKKMIWSVYQPDTWTLSERLTGLCTISFRVYDKMHIKGFSFKKQERAWFEITAVSADSIYGDAFTKEADAVCGIGNNVTLSFGEVVFNSSPTAVVIDGRANKAVNTLHMIFKDPITGAEEKEILEFSESTDYTTKEFAISKRTGTWDVSFVFLPGSNFDFRSFKFK